MRGSRRPLGARRALGLLTAAALVLAACSDPPITDDNRAAGDIPAIPLPSSPVVRAELFGREGVSPVPDVDTSVASVELGDVIFDTFGRGPLTLADSTFEQRVALLDAIPPIDDPPFVDPATDPWLGPDAVVLGFVDADGQAYASPHLILALHEIVNTTLAGQPVLISYCPLCNSGVVFSRLVAVDTGGTEVLTFSNTSALYDSDMVMVDRETGSYWWQVAGRSIVGPLTDVALAPLPSSTMTWSQWRDLHPETLVLSRDLGFGRDYTRDRFQGYAERVDEGFAAFPVTEEALTDGRLSPATQVIVVDAGGEAVAVPASDEPAATELDVAGQPVVVLTRDGGGGAFSATIDGDDLELVADGEGFTDRSTGETFGLDGQSLETGRQLESVPSRSSFWFAVVAAFPEVEVVSAAR